MNVQQLGAGRVHVGFFFLTAALAGYLGILLSTSIKPVERALLRARQRIADNNYMDLEWVERRDIIRRSTIGNKIINAMTVIDDNGNAVFDDPHEFHAVFMSWCRLNLRNLWAIIMRTKAPYSRDHNCTP